MLIDLPVMLLVLKLPELPKNPKIMFATLKQQPN